MYMISKVFRENYNTSRLNNITIISYNNTDNEMQNLGIKFVANLQTTQKTMCVKLACTEDFHTI